MSEQAQITSFFKKKKPQLARALTTPINAPQRQRRQKRKRAEVSVTKDEEDDEPIKKPIKRSRISQLDEDEQNEVKSEQKEEKKPRSPPTTSQRKKKRKPALQRSKTSLEPEQANTTTEDPRLRPRPRQRNPDRSRSRLLRSVRLPNGTVLEVRMGDICYEDVGAVVNAANSHLAHGGGVAGAIRRAAGSRIQVASDRWVREHGPVETGSCAYTAAYDIPYTSWVIHAVGPIWRRGKEAKCDAELRSCTLESCKQAERMNLPSLSIPAISSGIFGFPKPRCARIMFDAAIHFDQSCKHDQLNVIRYTNFDSLTAGIFTDEFDSRFDDEEEGDDESNEDKDSEDRDNDDSSDDDSSDDSIENKESKDIDSDDDSSDAEIFILKKPCTK
mmetsp:Transcript_19044/g.21207  ORF Transcript_19044/g.21207 Transcript_19044/m.21207 type:complete len:387 (+) Transcript_19044:71-1231(+)